MNVFEIRLGTGEEGRGTESPGSHSSRVPRPPSLYFLDLPGYGYARVSQADRVAFRRLVTHALRRPGVVGVIWLLDIRHEPSKDDRVMQDLLAATEARVLAVLTKSDKLPPGQRVRRSAALQTSLGVDDDQIIMTSAQHGEGISDLRPAIAALTGTRAA